jgi:hypothetical protein
MDEGVEMGTMLEHLVELNHMVNGPPQTQRQPILDKMAKTHVVQKVFSIVDELAAIFESLPNIFESNANNEPISNTMEMLIENDEAIGVEIVGLQEAC